MRELSGRCPERRRCSAGRQRGLSRRQAPVVWAAIKAPLFPGCCCRRRREREKKKIRKKRSEIKTIISELGGVTRLLSYAKRILIHDEYVSMRHGSARSRALALRQQRRAGQKRRQIDGTEASAVACLTPL